VTGLTFSAGTARLVREASPVEDLAGPWTDTVTMDDCPSDGAAADNDGDEAVVVEEGGNAAGGAGVAAQGRDESGAPANAEWSPGKAVSVHASEGSLNELSASDEVPSGSGSWIVREVVRMLEASVSSETVGVCYGPGDMSRSQEQGRGNVGSGSFFWKR
jgi:hypothetical protein